MVLIDLIKHPIIDRQLLLYQNSRKDKISERFGKYMVLINLISKDR